MRLKIVKFGNPLSCRVAAQPPRTVKDRFTRQFKILAKTEHRLLPSTDVINSVRVDQVSPDEQPEILRVLLDHHEGHLFGGLVK